MEIRDLLDLKDDDLEDDVKDEVFSVLVKARSDDFPRRSLRNVLEICISILKFKGDQMTLLQEQIDSNVQAEGGDEFIDGKLFEENEKLKRTVTKLEAEKMSFKLQITEMNDEMTHLRNRLHEMNAAESDKDSSDPLSELDRQEELLKNISTKNKHIKRLLRDIEELQKQNVEQSKTIIDLEREIGRSKAEIEDMVSRLSASESDKKALNDSIEELNVEINRLESNITYLEDERDRSEEELKQFIKKLEDRAYAWRCTIDEKEEQLESLRKRYEELYHRTPSGIVEYSQEAEVKRLVEVLQEKDTIIEELESKLKSMAEEMVASTQLMNKISAEREEEKQHDSNKKRNCCKKLEASLFSANSRCKELSEMLETIEEDNILKSKQAVEALAALEAYKNGEDGLAQSLRKVSQLQQKLASRDRQIKALVMEVNSLHEISHENTLLRKKLNIPEDAIISTTNLIAKQRSKEKMMDRLNLKLRASEEMRLHLKIEKSELQNKIIELQKQLSKLGGDTQIEVNPNSAIVEVKRAEVYCDNCLRNIQALPNQDSVIKDIISEWEAKYSNVIEENENLRVGMHEILEKIREYDASSEHITIDCTILEKVLHALDARSISGWYHPAMRMQNELIAAKEREKILREQVNIFGKVQLVEKEIRNVKQAEVDKSEKSEEEPSPTLKVGKVDDIEHEEEQEKQIVNNSDREKSTQTPRSEELYPILAEKDAETHSARNQLSITSEKYRDLLLEVEELKIFKIQYHEIMEKLRGDENEITKYCSSILDKVTEQEIQIISQRKKYNFLKDDLDQTLTSYKNSESQNIALIAELKKQLNDKKHEMSLLKASDNQYQIAKKLNDANNCDLEKRYLKTQAQLALLIEKIFSGKVPDFIVKLNEKDCLDYGVISDNLQISFLTLSEYEKLQAENKELVSTYNDLKLQCKHLEELQSISQEQLKSQQKLISEITDNHIDLRHLVADLQSTSEDKFLICKLHRDIDTAKHEISKLKGEKEQLQTECVRLSADLRNSKNYNDDLRKKQAEDLKNNELKLRFLGKSLNVLRENYCKYTPLVFLANFVTAYQSSLNGIKPEENTYSQIIKDLDNSLSSKIATGASTALPQDLIDLVKYEIKCNFLEKQLSHYVKRAEGLQQELNEIKLSNVENNEHWRTIQALFGKDTMKPEVTSISSQCVIETKNVSTNTCHIIEETKREEIRKNGEAMEEFKLLTPKSSPKRIVEDDQRTISDESSPSKTFDIKSPNIISLERQLKQAMNLASMRSALLLETENRLAEAQGRIKEMEKILEGKKQLLKQEIEKTSNAEERAFQKSSSIIESTISSLQTLLSEKDNTLSHYQELLKTEREQHTKSCDNYEKEILSLKKSINGLETEIKTKEMENSELRCKIEATNSPKTPKIDLDLNDEIENIDKGESNFNDISDEKIEEMFFDESKHMIPPIFSESSHHDADNSMNRQMQQMQFQLKESKNREIFWEKSIRAKDEEISLLKEKLTLLQEREKLESNSVEIDQLKLLLEEKDKHISDLMDTLTSFHDDQQRFINETSFYSADQVSQLGADLSRCENTNKILNAQLEALRRQVASLSQREKQARDLANSLKTQLIKRPVIPVKSEPTTRKSNEQLQKRVNQLENELDEAKQEIRRQQNIIDAKRAKNATEISLWEKQKRWQQNAEKLRIKLTETEAALEKTKNMLSIARTTIEKLEKEKHSAESKQKAIKCCRTPSCPNLLTRYAQSDTPDSMTGASDTSSPIRKHHMRVHLFSHEQSEGLESTTKEIIHALKLRIEAQQRKIVALELEGKGSNTLITEVEKLQERISELEAHNIRLEARNLQVQLDNDLLRQGDEAERLKKRIKHLEDYIIALKEEMARLEAVKSKGALHHEPKDIGQLEQTILALKRIIEKLRVENRNLKEGRRHQDFRTQESRDKAASSEISRLQHLYSEALDKISALQIDIQLKSGCCSVCREKTENNFEGGGDLVNELKMVKEQLVKKTQLLEKAKILLTRAAAKEKNLKEQLAIWKRKCSELQNVPVIDEISE